MINCFNYIILFRNQLKLYKGESIKKKICFVEKNKYGKFCFGFYFIFEVFIGNLIFLIEIIDFFLDMIWMECDDLKFFVCQF